MGGRAAGAGEAAGGAGAGAAPRDSARARACSIAVTAPAPYFGSVEVEAGTAAASGVPSAVVPGGLGVRVSLATSMS